MTQLQDRLQAASDVEIVPNGSGAAAILAAGIGCASLGIFAFAGDVSPAMSKMLNIYNPTGALSGVTTFAIIIWLASWVVLGRMWGGRTVKLGAVTLASFALLAVGFLLTCPPIMDLLQGK